MEVLLAVLVGLPITLAVTAGAFGIGVVGSLPLLMATRVGPKVWRLAVRFAIDLIRAVPPLVWLFFIYFGISIGGARLTPLSAAIMGLGVISSAYICEIFRGASSRSPRDRLRRPRRWASARGPPICASSLPR